MSLEALIARYGLAALCLGAGLEGETTVVLGGVMVHRGVLDYLPAIAAAATGSFLADQTFFAIGRRFRNHPVVQRLQQKPAFKRSIAAFERRPKLFIFSFRFLYGLRTISPVAIGTTDLATARFVPINAVAAIIWATVFVSLGYLFGEGVEQAFGRVREISHILVPGVAILLAAGLIVRILRRRSLSREADT